MKKILLILCITIISLNIAYAENRVLRDETASIKKMLPVEQNGLVLADITYIPKKGMMYTYILDSKGKTVDELKVAIDGSKNKTISNLCSAVPKYLQDEFIKDDTPMVYIFVTETDITVDSITVDFTKCAKK